MLRFIVCLLLCLSLPGQSAWAAWRMASSPASQSSLNAAAAMPCHGDASVMQGAIGSDDQDGLANEAPTLKASSTCPHCGTCAACVMAHALPANPTVTTAIWQPQAAPPEPAAARVPPFTTAGPDRPPRVV